MENTETKQDFIIVKAGPEHSEAIRELYNSISYEAAIDIQFRRGDDPYEALATEGLDSEILLIRENCSGKYIGMGACCIHEMYLDGRVCRVGYLNGLKLLPEYRKKLTLLPKGYAAMWKALEGRVDLCFASVLNSSEYVQKMFEKRRKFMPAYVYQCDYTTFIFKPCCRDSLGLVVGKLEGLDEFYEKNCPRYNLSWVRPLRGVTDENRLVWVRDGRILAACALVNEQKYKNYFLNKYNGYMRFVSRLPSKLFGYPAFPKEKSVVNSVALSMLMFDESVTDREKLSFIRSASSHAREYEMCMLGSTDTDSTYEVCKKLRHVSFNSKLYTIDWGEDSCITGKPVLPDTTVM